MGFIDKQKAFDKSRKKLWIILWAKKVSMQLVKLMQNIYDTNKSVIIRNGKCFFFNKNVGLRQGGRLSTALFVIYIDSIIRECENKSKGFHVGYRNLQKVQVYEGAFADDVMILASSSSSSRNHLQYNMVV